MGTISADVSEKTSEIHGVIRSLQIKKVPEWVPFLFEVIF